MTICLMVLFASTTGGHAQSYTSSKLDPICGVGQDAALGCDAIRDRRIIDVTQAPWRGIGRVNFGSVQLRKHCTGALVAEQIVLTAAHCLFNNARNAWIPAQSIHFVAGYQRGDYTASASATRYVLPPGQDPSGNSFSANSIDDWALLVLDAPIGNTAGFLATATLAPNPDDTVVIAGYTRLRPHVASLAENCGSVARTITYGLVTTTCAAMPGDSGGPLLVIKDDTVTVAGINVSSAGDGVIAQLRSIPPVYWAEPLQALKLELANQ